MKILHLIAGLLLVAGAMAQSSRYYTDSIYSKSLSEYRVHNIYLPPNFDPSKSYRVIYATDGFPITSNDTRQQLFDSLINGGYMAPVIFAASYCNRNNTNSYMTLGTGEKIYNSYRYYDYVMNAALSDEDAAYKDRYTQHASYFQNEFIPAIENHLKISVTPKDRIFFGFSNGAGFGVSFLNLHPEVIGTYLCMSPVGTSEDMLKWNKPAYPALYMSYGKLEGPYVSGSVKEVKKGIKKKTTTCEVREFDCGHDYSMWNAEMIRLLGILAPGSKNKG